MQPRNEANPCASRDPEEELERKESEPDPWIIFRRHFEAQFKPLPTLEAKNLQVVLHDDLDQSYNTGDESEWDGFSDEEAAIQVVEHTETKAQLTKMSQAELKYFMNWAWLTEVPKSSKPPQGGPTAPISKSIIDDQNDLSEAANLRKDIALQRLLNESHLIDSIQNSTISGKNRHKATDLRLRALGSKTSILNQKNMPLSHRKGIDAKNKERETKRKKEARENGIILEKATFGGKKTFEKRRDRGIGAPSIGIFSRGTLRLSEKDIKGVEGSHRTRPGEKKRYRK
ncbi:hypothetical protein GcM3_103007 [Golovinomyces cichoracearum]|uniref:Uncharacterized protein n=1 Tax=Golovinomyces cichoracearum TaxID=62708 RepID=A0A420IA26_9PEZI|nr:hypothetical protein GcM3_103007 [Golovinomyces cichoracearum]